MLCRDFRDRLHETVCGRAPDDDGRELTVDELHEIGEAFNDLWLSAMVDATRRRLVLRQPLMLKVEP